MGNVFPDWTDAAARRLRQLSVAATMETRGPEVTRDERASASASSAAASTPASTSRRSARCATPTCAASGARTRTPSRAAAPRGSSTSATRGRTRRIADMVADPAIDAIWLCGPQPRAHRERRGDRPRDRARQRHARGLACEKPLARNVAEAKRVAELVRRVGLTHGLSREPALRAARRGGQARCSGRAARRRPDARTSRARPRSTAGRTCRGSGSGDAAGRRRAQRHDVPLGARRAAPAHRSPAQPLRHVQPVRVTGHIASLKWSRPEYAQALHADDGRGGRLREARRPRTSRA